MGGREGRARLLERDRELESLDMAIRSAVAGSGSLLIVEGEAGIGKTVLLAEAKRRGSAAGMAILGATAVDLERDVSYGVVRQLFEPVFAYAPRSRHERLLSGAAGLAAAVVSPTSTSSTSQRIDDRRFPVVHGLFWLASNLATEAPLMLVIDDAHWSDRPSVTFLSYLAKRLEDLGIVVIVALRVGEASQAAVTLGDGANELASKVLRPTGLSHSAISELASNIFGCTPPPEFVAACHQSTQGVPFLVRELLNAVVLDDMRPDELAAERIAMFAPQTVAHATILRLSHLSAGSADVARAVAVLGRRAGVRQVAGLTGLPDEQVQVISDQLTAAGLFRTGRPLGFVHPIVASALYDDLPAGERAVAHARAARLLAEEDADPEEVAAHLLWTDPTSDGWGQEILLRAAAQASSHGAPEIAIPYLERALGEARPSEARSQIRWELGRARMCIQDPLSVAELEEALRFATSDRQRMEIVADLVSMLVAMGRWGDARSRAAWAQRNLRDVDPVASLPFEAFLAAFAAYDPSRAPWLEQERARLESLAAREPGSGWGLIAIFSVVDVNRVVQPEAAASRAERLLDDGIPPGPEEWLMQILGSLIPMEHFERAEMVAKEMLTEARHRASVYGIAAALSALARIAGFRGDLRSQEEDLLSSFELVQEHGLIFGVPSLANSGIDALIERPALANYVDLVATVELEPAFAATISGAWLLEAQARLRLARGIYDGVEDRLRKAGAVADAVGIRHPTVSSWRSTLALALLPTDRVEAARLASEELCLAQATGLARPQGVAMRVAGKVEGGEKGIEMLGLSLGMLASSSAPLERSRTLVELGSALRRRGSRASARELLREGLVLAQHCGAQRLVARIEDELAATGARRVHRPVSGRDALTPSEARVARLASDGLTNAEIAQALFVTTKTVEKHLGATYSKLALTGRHQLSGALRDSQSPVPDN